MLKRAYASINHFHNASNIEQVSLDLGIVIHYERTPFRGNSY